MSKDIQVMSIAELKRELKRCRHMIQVSAHSSDLPAVCLWIERAEEIGALINLEEGATSWGISPVTAEEISRDFDRHHGNNNLTAPYPKVSGQERIEREPAGVLEKLALFVCAVFCICICFLMWLAD